MATATQAADVSSSQGGISRREFLYYIWGASIALFTAQFTGLLVWFMLPRFGEGEFGGVFRKAVSLLPAVNQPPVPDAEGRFWLVNVDSTDPNRLMFQSGDEAPIKGVLAIYKVCTHLGCIYDWNEANDRFECPCHGSKYRLDGRRYQNPAPRTLDRFEVIAVDADGNELARSTSGGEGEEGWLPLELPEGTAEVLIDTGSRKDGAGKEVLGVDPPNRPTE